MSGHDRAYRLAPLRWQECEPAGILSVKPHLSRCFHSHVQRERSTMRTTALGSLLLILLTGCGPKAPEAQAPPAPETEVPDVLVEPSVHEETAEEARARIEDQERMAAVNELQRAVCEDGITDQVPDRCKPENPADNARPMVDLSTPSASN
jgi:hypothetical protein